MGGGALPVGAQTLVTVSAALDGWVGLTIKTAAMRCLAKVLLVRVDCGIATCYMYTYEYNKQPQVSMYVRTCLSSASV